MYSIRSFRDPEDDDGLFREVIFDTRTRVAIQLKDNLSMFILQHYSSSNLNERGEGSVQCCTECHKTNVTTNEMIIRIRCHPNYRRGQGYSSSGQVWRRTSHVAYRRAFQERQMMVWILSLLYKAAMNGSVVSHSSFH